MPTDCASVPATCPITRLQAPAPATASAMLTTPFVSPPASVGPNSVRNCRVRRSRYSCALPSAANGNCRASTRKSGTTSSSGTDVRQQRGREPRGREEHEGADDPDPEGGGGDARVLGVGAVDQRRAEPEVARVLEEVDDGEREGHQAELARHQQAREHDRRDEHQRLARRIGGARPQEAAERPAAEVTHSASPPPGRCAPGPGARRPGGPGSAAPPATPETNTRASSAILRRVSVNGSRASASMA